MQRVNLTIKNNQDFCLTFTIQDSKYQPYYISGALFYMDIKEKDGGLIKIASISNDDSFSPQGKVYIIDEQAAKIKLFLQRDHYQGTKFINTWAYDLVMRQYNTYFNIMSGSFTILDSVTNPENDEE